MMGFFSNAKIRMYLYKFINKDNFYLFYEKTSFMNFDSKIKWGMAHIEYRKTMPISVNIKMFAPLEHYVAYNIGNFLLLNKEFKVTDVVHIDDRYFIYEYLLKTKKRQIIELDNEEFYNVLQKKIKTEQEYIVSRI